MVIQCIKKETMFFKVMNVNRILVLRLRSGFVFLFSTIVLPCVETACNEVLRLERLKIILSMKMFVKSASQGLALNENLGKEESCSNSNCKIHCQ